MLEPARLQRFEGFSFDRARGILQAEGRACSTLRPKTTAVLEHLLRHNGEVVSREALIADVWSGLCVSDDNLTQCVSEIRRALGPEAAALLRTLPRRGYLLAAAPLPAPPAVPALLPIATPAAMPEAGPVAAPADMALAPPPLPSRRPFLLLGAAAMALLLAVALSGSLGSGEPTALVPQASGLLAVLTRF